MDTTFITIHDLSEDAKILYCSDSIVDILGFTPDEVVNRSVWNWFHEDEVPFAKAKHNRGVNMDKAAVLAYAQIRNRNGQFIGCECCFSIVYDVMVCCTSVYRQGLGSQKRAVDAPLVRRLFASSPKDPRYHMLSHLSAKFSLGDTEQSHEPRAALFLNRFTRTLTVMYATSGIEQIIGISSEDMKGRSFYFCIEERCLEDAVKCLESAKGNDSIAYMRFYFRDPRQDDPPRYFSDESEDDVMTDVTSEEGESNAGDDPSSNGEAPGYSGPSSGSGDQAHERGPRNGSAAPSSASSVPGWSPRSDARPEPIELEAVISCTSDGLVVCLRRARPMVPTPLPSTGRPTHQSIFAAPWAVDPVLPSVLGPPPPFPLGAPHPAMAQDGQRPGFRKNFLDTIRDVAVFAWALAGINGCLVDYAKGKPKGESQPPDGFPVWAPEPVQPREKLSAAPSGYVSGNSSSSNGRSDPFGDPGLS